VKKILEWENFWDWDCCKNGTNILNFDDYLGEGGGYGKFLGLE